MSDFVRDPFLLKRVGSDRILDDDLLFFFRLDDLNDGALCTAPFLDRDLEIQDLAVLKDALDDRLRFPVRC